MRHHPGMIRKRIRSEAEIRELAEELRAKKRESESIEAWMRRHVIRLTRLVRDKAWRWEDIGRAMTAAGIAYETGRPWTARVLSVRASVARAQIRARKIARQEPTEYRQSPSPYQSIIRATAAEPLPDPDEDPTPRMTLQKAKLRGVD